MLLFLFLNDCSVLHIQHQRVSKPGQAPAPLLFADASVGSEPTLHLRVSRLQQ